LPETHDGVEGAQQFNINGLGHGSVYLHHWC
jgi:hypothetical protein